MKSAASQKGLSFFGWLLALALVAFVASTAFKLIPHYLDYMSMKKIIMSVETDKAAGVTTVSDFYTHVARGMQVNSIQDVDLNKALSVTVENNRFLAHLKYEQRDPLIQNIDLVVKFDHEFSVGKP
ncbi:MULTISPECIES: DUF4845 domain-containing protein [Pseudomonas]|uniref:DUF4845 domain-containing protein n=2 Tax=Pseudomonas gingeri TaxID=117681 RepID=A0A7Y7XZG9_9PSED|nr:MULTISPECIES: DUF4845 domain-containing protein [Pseudomonas]NVZ27291.1 DUF4845 domain-containing protein [Pseudomonas gingeri]NVZ63922.1 DUF4845 domain-containing protein [Pseudomonas gingeri]NVZ74607.1 DUF4845 domain-containing protein [Pseudomonas gingeri]NWA03230.1 DUF4845 domain-containing protein [Pseudomonas gingeri]NWA07603.1 DUF4845 domain-containing protein [Pseudomonas gingeri]